jgi:flagellin FlaB
MGKRMQRRGGNKRGIVGIEAAIVLIAFVVIAAALAYVVINMGFFAAQRDSYPMPEQNSGKGQG